MKTTKKPKLTREQLAALDPNKPALKIEQQVKKERLKHIRKYGQPN